MNRVLPISAFAQVRRNHRRCGFTLIELLAASLASALILVAIYGIFQRAVKTRTYATERTRQSRQRDRAANIIRNDLRNTFLSGGLLADALEGGSESQKSRFPGYLRFTNTTGKSRSGETYGDVQQVEYYISDGTTTGSAGNVSPSDNPDTGTLVRALTRDLLATTAETAPEETLLTCVQSFEVTFYDGQTWQETWQVADSTSALPQAIRVRIQQTAPSEHIPAPPLLEILVPITTEALSSTATATTSTSGTSGSASTSGTTAK